jgi:hypothetical protein
MTPQDAHDTARTVIRCIACDGFGWHDTDPDEPDDFGEPGAAGETECRWCAGIGYVYREIHGGAAVDRPIPAADLAALHDQLEVLEAERLRALGYTGSAKKPWEQAVREGRNPLDGSVKRP